MALPGRGSEGRAGEHRCADYLHCVKNCNLSTKLLNNGPNKIPVPEAFFKVILCDNPLKGIGFICRNTDGNRKKDFYVNSIRQIERVTEYDFFPILPDSIKNIVETCSDLADWD